MVKKVSRDDGSLLELGCADSLSRLAALEDGPLDGDGSDCVKVHTAAFFASVPLATALLYGCVSATL